MSLLRRKPRNLILKIKVAFTRQQKPALSYLATFMAISTGENEPAA
jgi:hypothetical protein